MTQAMGALGWTPRDFWLATPLELYTAIDGWNEANGAKPEDEREPLRWEDFEDMRERYPDGGGSIKGSPTARTYRITGKRR